VHKPIWGLTICVGLRMQGCQQVYTSRGRWVSSLQVSLKHTNEEFPASNLQYTILRISQRIFYTHA
jgi:hypothetical protein